MPRQINDLIDKAVSTGKGANATISCVHDFFISHRAGETDAQIKADNNVGHRRQTTFLSGTTPRKFFVGCTNNYCIRF